MLRRFVCALATGAAMALPAQAEDQVTDSMLENGMQAVVVEDHRAPVVMHCPLYPSGAAEERSSVVRGG